MTLGLSASRQNARRRENEAARPSSSETQHPSAEQSLKNVLDNSNKAAARAGKSPEIARETTDKTTVAAPAVTHEVVKPKVHEIMHEQIERDVHEHHVVQKIQPVVDVEVLPAKHYVPGPDGRLVEVAEQNLPGCTGENSNWHIGSGPSTSGCSVVPGDERKTSATTQEYQSAELEEGSVPVKRSGGIERTEDTITPPPPPPPPQMRAMPPRPPLFRHLFFRRPPPQPRSYTSPSQPPQPPEPTSAAISRADRILARLPRSLQKYTNRLRGAPATHVVAFLLLHEITAIVPVFALFGLFHYTEYDVPVDSFGDDIKEGAARMVKYLGKKGWVDLSGEGAGVESAGVTGQQGQGASWEAMKNYRVLWEFAAAYAVTKVLLPVRIGVSLWATPGFAGLLGRVRGLVRWAKR
ncbi:hypothetical protein QBC42DRAFT_291672 [Cladorrhinum samala]|uniref:Uncharacterized protein n=1 Tax=Cladorrhinum samala TaxID=585594 RepID=A0AAV9H9G9_9PEZI|nr:hypothetical protein QBC42DRAFT_291672 [Cladorrhinum samala]